MAESRDYTHLPDHLQFPALVARACLQSSELRTVHQLARRVNMSLRSLQRKCRSNGICAKQALDFVRCAAVVIDSTDDWRTEALFPDLDPRTAARLSDIAALDSISRPSIEDFMCRQRAITEPRFCRQLLLELRSLMTHDERAAAHD